MRRKVDSLELIAAWIRHMRALDFSETGTIRTYSYRVVTFGAYVAAEHPGRTLVDVDEDIVEAHVAGLGGHGPTRATAVQAPRSFYGSGARRGYVRDPTIDLVPRSTP